MARARALVIGPLGAWGVGVESMGMTVGFFASLTLSFDLFLLSGLLVLDVVLGLIGTLSSSS